MFARTRSIGLAWHRFRFLPAFLLALASQPSLGNVAFATQLTAYDQAFCTGYSEFKLAPTRVVFPRLSDADIRHALFGVGLANHIFYMQYFQRGMLLFFRQDHLKQAELSDLWLQILNTIHSGTGKVPMNFGFVAPDGTQVFHNGANGRVLLINADGEIFRFQDKNLPHFSLGWRPDFSVYDPMNGTDLVSREEAWGALATELNIPTPEYSVLEEMLDLPAALPLLNSPDAPRVQGRLKAQAEEILNALPADAPHRRVLRRRLGEILWRYGVDLG